MAGLRKIGFFFLLLIFLFTGSSCMLMKEAPPPKSSVPAQDQDRQPSTADHPGQVIDTYKAAMDKAPQNQDLMRDYAKNLEAMHNAAERSYSRQDCAPAGKIYHLLLKRYPDFKDIAHLLSFNRTQLNTRLTHCKTALYQKGFQEYREGHLSRAIATWEDYLEIDPDNADIKRALSTAKAQQHNLRNR